MNLQMIDFKPKPLRVPEWVKNVASIVFFILTIFVVSSVRYEPPHKVVKTACNVRQVDYFGRYNETVSYQTFERISGNRCLVNDGGHLMVGYEEEVVPLLPVAIDSPIK